MLWGICKTASGSEIPPSAPSPMTPVRQETSEGDAEAKIHSMTIDHQRANSGMSYQQAYAYLYTKPENQALREEIKRNHLARTRAAAVAKVR